MSEHAYEDYDEVLPEEPNGELVHWMAPRPKSFSMGAVAIAAAGGFALGVASALIVMGTLRLAVEDRRLALPFRRGGR